MSKITVDLVDVDTTEEYVLNETALAPELRGWRIYRIEYGGPNQDCLFEGRILLPPRADPDAVAQLILGMQAYEQIWTVEQGGVNETQDKTEKILVRS